MVQIFKVAVLAMLASFVLTSCSSDAEKEQDITITQQQNISAYLDAIRNMAPPVATVPSPVANVYRVVFEQGNASKAVAKGDSIIFYYKAAVFSKDGQLGFGKVYDTNIDTVAKNNHLDTTKVFAPTRAIAGSEQLLPGLSKGLLQMAEGERSQLIFTSDMGYGSRQVGAVPPSSPLIFEVHMIEVKKK